MPTALLAADDRVTRPRPAIGAFPLVRLRPAPQSEPPYDDEDLPPFDEPAEHGAFSPPEWSGPSDWPSAPEKPSTPQKPSTPKVPAAPERPGTASPVCPSGGAAHPGGPPVGLARQATYRLVNVCLEVLDGFRPIGHLRRLTVGGSFDAVARQLSRPVARSGHAPISGCVLPPVQAAGRIRVQHIQIGEPRPGVVEAVAVLGRNGRAWALALRLEIRGGSWLCTHLEVI